MKLVLRILFFLLLGALAIGLYYKNQIEFSLGERIIGFTVLGGAFIYLPLFLYHHWKGKSLQDYTMSDENLKKMREK
ncbi:hypothetical protein N9C07_04295 [Flavobacteriaceae bacterium]|nr:hypothetical protein [Flavobacteriaceae bacterium]MDC1543441.1 hypothetical protein [Flavobacteriaceae bacterium]